jgi:hypothetical protein
MEVQQTSETPRAGHIKYKRTLFKTANAFSLYVTIFLA